MILFNDYYIFEIEFLYLHNYIISSFLNRNEIDSIINFLVNDETDLYVDYESDPILYFLNLDIRFIPSNFGRFAKFKSIEKKNEI